ncbi:hypothetical protein ACK1H7_004778 [Salmonella enterica]
MQALFLVATEPVTESTADHHSYGFRPKRSAADAIENCRVRLTWPYGGLSRVRGNCAP